MENRTANGHQTGQQADTVKEVKKLRREEKKKERLEAFRVRCLEVHQQEKILTKDEAKKFFDYWTETSEGALKHQWEFKKTFNIKLRMEQWAQRIGPTNGAAKSEPVAYSPRG